MKSGVQKLKKMYVLLRKDLDPIYASVQAGHAVAEFCLKNSNHHKWNNDFLIYLAVKNEDKLSSWAYKLKSNKISYEMFKEPDIGYQKTALATVCSGEVFKKLKLF